MIPTSKRFIDAIKSYTAEATVFDGQPLSKHAGPRTNDIVLVLGPSGSGKTLFSLNGFPDPKDATRSVTVYVKASSVVVDSERSSPKDLKDYIRPQLKKRLEQASSPFIKKKLDMGVSLVIDEAAALGDWIKDYKKLEMIYDEVVLIAKHPRLILAGTGIDEITKGLDSNIQVRWSDFKVICSINELQELVVNMKKNVLVDN